METQVSRSPEDFCWHTLNDVEYMQRRWDHDLVVYNTGSGDTHLLETISAELFLYLQAHHATLSEIVAHIADIFHYEIDNDLQMHITELLMQLEKLRLVEAV